MTLPIAPAVTVICTSVVPQRYSLCLQHFSLVGSGMNNPTMEKPGRVGLLFWSRYLPRDWHSNPTLHTYCSWHHFCSWIFGLETSLCHFHHGIREHGIEGAQWHQTPRPRRFGWSQEQRRHIDVAYGKKAATQCTQDSTFAGKMTEADDIAEKLWLCVDDRILINTAGQLGGMRKD